MKKRGRFTNVWITMKVYRLSMSEAKVKPTATNPKPISTIIGREGTEVSMPMLVPTRKLRRKRLPWTRASVVPSFFFILLLYVL